MNDTPGWASPGSADDRNANPPRTDRPADADGPATGWAGQQPPAGQWSTPPGTGHGGPPPAPGRGGGPYQGWGAPPALKPGVIPLRPLGTSEILDGATSTLRRYWRPVLGITLTVSVVAQICITVINRLFGSDPVEVDPDASPEEALRQSVDAARAAFVDLLPSMAIGMVVTFFTTALLTVIVSRAVLGRPVTIGEAWQEARPRLPQLLALTLLLPLIAVAIGGVAMAPGLLLDGSGGAALLSLGILVAIPLIVFLLVRLALAPTVLMLERQGVAEALRRSSRLVQGSWWRTFAILLLAMVIVLLVQVVISVPFTAIGYAMHDGGLADLMDGRAVDSWPVLIATGIGAVIGYALTYPISAGVTALLYVDQRIRRESLDLELVRAAGIPGTEPSAPTSSGKPGI
ncbi:hypothetical protein ABT354_33670 [Streptomyces sp. NPDC000594]|uniref:glycerophosphoryl diester phosphodiesterase membrane domain-containing protein n=1 Tax=Streptomyces sp. NPDC000594 TaxID=3154261 RepID=UPI003333BEC2